MKWVGILYVKDTVRLNGMHFADHWQQLINTFFLNQNRLPRWLIILVADSNALGKQVVNLKEQVPQSCQLIYYHRWIPLIYIHENKQHYYLSVIMGILIGIMSCFYWLQESKSMVIKMPKNHRYNNAYNQIMNQLANHCNQEQCITELAIYPKEYMVRLIDQQFEQSFLNSGCQSIPSQTGVIKCTK